MFSLEELVVGAIRGATVQVVLFLVLFFVLWQVGMKVTSYVIDRVSGVWKEALSLILWIPTFALVYLLVAVALAPEYQLLPGGVLLPDLPFVYRCISLGLCFLFFVLWGKYRVYTNLWVVFRELSLGGLGALFVLLVSSGVLWAIKNWDDAFLEREVFSRARDLLLRIPGASSSGSHTSAP